LKPSHFVVCHYRAKVRLASQKQYRTSDIREDMFVVIAFCETVEVVKQHIKVPG
jgi:hypothetical protein